MAIIDPVLPSIDNVIVNYQLINYHTLQPISHSGSYASINNNQFVFLKVKSNLTNFDKRINKVFLTFKQYTSFNYQVYLNESNAAHFISSTQVPLRKYLSNNIICYEADITDFVSRHPNEEIYFAITASSSLSIYVSGLNKPTGFITTYSTKAGDYSPYHLNRVKTYTLRNYCLDIDLFTSIPSHVFNLFNYSNELLSFNLSLNSSFSNRDSNLVNSTINTHLPKGFKFSAQQYVYANGSNSFTYVDENYFYHVFISFANDDGSFTHFIDSNGAYLILEVLNNGYKIYSLDGNVKTFSSSGYLINETIKNGANSSEIIYSYTNDFLTGISINNESLVTITYNAGSVVISLPDNSFITFNFDNNNYLNSIVDQENVTYLIEYKEDNPGLIEEVKLLNTKVLSLSFNKQLMVNEVSIFVYDSTAEDYAWVVGYDFWYNPYSASYLSDDNIIYNYKFDSDGQVIQTFSYKYNNPDVLDVSSFIKTNGHSFILSTRSSNFLKEITHNFNTYLHFENSVTLTSSTHLLNFSIKPKEKGQYFLYFEFAREVSNFYQTLNTFSIKLSVSNGSNTYSIVETTSVDINGFDKTNIFMKEIIIPEEFYQKNLNLTFYLSSGDSYLTISNIRLYRLEGSSHEYYGINFPTSANNLNLLSDETNPTSFYELSSSFSFEADSLSYSVNSSYEDLKNSLLAKFYLNKGVLFYNNGKNAYFGNITRNNTPLSGFKLVRVSYNNKRISQDNEPYDSYKAHISYFDNDYFKEKEVQYVYSFSTYSTSEKSFDHNYLLVNNIISFPRGTITTPNSQGGSYTYHKYQESLNYIYNSYGELLHSTLVTNASNHPQTYYERASNKSTYSSDYKYLSVVNQKLYNASSEINDISFSYQYNSVGDISKKIDAYNKEESYDYNKFHQLSSLLAYNLASFHNNNVVYDNLLNVSSYKHINNLNQVCYSYDYKDRLSNISYDTMSISFNYSLYNDTIYFSDNNNSYSVSNTYSNYRLPLEFKIDNTVVLSYQYINKNNSFVGVGDPSNDLLEEIKDYKGLDNNSYRRKSYSYDEYGNISSISENGITLEFSTSLFLSSIESDYGVPGDAIKKSVTYSNNNGVFRTEKNYSFFQDPFLKYKNVVDNSISYVVGVAESTSSEVSGGPQLTLYIYFSDSTYNSVSTSFEYYKDENDKLTPFIKSQMIHYDYAPSYIYYSYDNKGNLISISSSDFNINNSYSYNDFNELSNENSTGFGQIVYQYDSYGNIIVISKYDSSEVYTFAYDNFNRLTSVTKSVGLDHQETLSFNGYSFGRPIVYKNKTLAWDKNELVQYDNVCFTYDGYSRRISKTNNSSRSVSYQYIENILLKEDITINNVTHTLKYLHNSNNNIVGFIYNNNVYFYIKDMLNNVIAIVDHSNEVIAKYLYDAYGNHKVLNPDGTEHNLVDETFIGNLNPIRYRSYYYDVETKLYYLKSRYYDPEICRFISMDDLSFFDPNKANGLNLYCYCLNNPVMFSDYDGCAPDWLYWVIGAVVLAGAVALTIVTGGSISPILIGTAVGTVSGVAFGGIDFSSGSFSWSWDGAAKGFCWGSIAGAIGGAVDMGASTVASTFGSKGVLSVAFRFTSNGLAAMGLGALQASIEGEKWSLERAAITFAFGGVSSLFGKGWISSTLFGFGFSAAEGTTGEFLDFYQLTVLKRKWSFL